MHDSGSVCPHRGLGDGEGHHVRPKSLTWPLLTSPKKVTAPSSLLAAHSSVVAPPTFQSGLLPGWLLRALLSLVWQQFLLI
jgi:hypothetical protein